AAGWRRGRRWSPPEAVRAGAVIWLVGWLPVSHLILPLQMIVVADRYLLLPTLGLALAVAAGVGAIASPRARRALAAAIVVAAGLRALDAQAGWRDSGTLWQRAVASNPRDGEAWSFYANTLVEAGRLDDAAAAGAGCR